MVRMGCIVFVIIYNPWLYFVSNTYRHSEVWKNFPWIFIPLNYDRNRTSSKSPEREKSLGSRVLQGEKRTKGKHAYKLKHTQKPNTHTGIPVTVRLWLTEPDAYFLHAVNTLLDAEYVSVEVKPFWICLFAYHIPIIE